MRSKLFMFLLLSLLTLCVGSAGIAASQSRTLTSTSVGPLDLSGEIDGAPYRIRVPEVWNGTLLIYVHGYRDKADHPGEIDNREPELAPNSALVAPLLAQGYALAGSAFKDNGWAVEEAMEDVKNLAVYFRENVGQPQRTILGAASV